ncbi:golgi reassembly stacking protein [Tieghemostelium lacteum]|uniref:Golgi reassembly stacking protein n=1 Tax=Tieghemostelium lacteum TaxID=361077 RepID=A0A151ZCV1_TIELA|nr:golgi reassembly stacking protein [Tieghemostelium lacteum]|eukprot:KYQ91761.1 golgi reassembly stacking protein [Tieghemostelium lacteum]
MGVNQSQPTNLNDQEDRYNKTGYHVLQVYQNSPSSGLLQSFFDFIVSANGVQFEKEDNRFADTFRHNIGKPVELLVYNIKSNSTRAVTITPSDSWGGQGLAGISIRYCSWSKILENVWHVLDVYLASPANEADLQTRTDYIVGTPDIILNEQEDFFTLINNNMYRPVQLYVYSSLTEHVRLVTITPNKNWGGSGSLGCDIGYGLLHRIPTKKNNLTSQTPSIDQIRSPQQPQVQLTNNNNSTEQTAIPFELPSDEVTKPPQSNNNVNNNLIMEGEDYLEPPPLPKQPQDQQSFTNVAL